MNAGHKKKSHTKNAPFCLCIPNSKGSKLQYLPQRVYPLEEITENV